MRTKGLTGHCLCCLGGLGHRLLRCCGRCTAHLLKAATCAAILGCRVLSLPSVRISIRSESISGRCSRYSHCLRVSRIVTQLTLTMQLRLWAKASARLQRNRTFDKRVISFHGQESVTQPRQDRSPTVAFVIQRLRPKISVAAHIAGPAIVALDDRCAPEWRGIPRPRLLGNR